MGSDFSGWATRVGLKCADGKTIMPGAFKDQDKVQVPLVWQHGHSNIENVLGHAILEYREGEGVWVEAFFNDSEPAQHAKASLIHRDINQLSIWANQLVERAGNVYHGVIREVSLVLSGANPGARIENVTIAHGDGTEYSLDDEVVIYTGLELQHAAIGGDNPATSSSEDETLEDIYNSLTPKQKDVVTFMLGQVITAEEDALVQSATDADAPAAEGETDSDAPAEDDTEADASADAEPDAESTDAAENDADAPADADADETDEAAGDEGVQHSDTNSNPEGNNKMTNVFENTGDAAQKYLSHSQLQEIISSAKTTGSLVGAIEAYGIQHAIANIELMFPDAQAISDQPDWVKRRTEWVDSFISGTRKSPFSKIKTLSADITEEDARAKGYITGTLKREEYFKVAKRTTEPTTIYKKQKLDRDDLIDITEYNVVAWLKAEMRLMLDEEIARAALLGDGRDVASVDKISESNIRPIATDNELYTIKVNVNIADALSTADEIIDAVIESRHLYKGTGQPNFYTTESQIAKFMMLKDTTGRRIYQNLAEIASLLRVAAIVPVEVMEEYPSIIGVIVNPVDYTFGANKGGEVNMFDDFDIDYNQLKYLIETRVCGALTKPKSAMVLTGVAQALVEVTPAAPVFNEVTGVMSIVNQTGVIYKIGATVVNAAGSPYAAIALGAEVLVEATPDTGYYFPNSEDDQWLLERTG